MSYSEGHVERFGTARQTINTASTSSATTDQVALKLGGKVGMTLEAYEAIAETVKAQEPLLTVPARHLQPGDTTHGFAVSQSYNFPDGSREFRFVVPYTTHSMTVLIQAKDLDGVSFPLTKRGDAHDPSPRNKALGLPEDLHRPGYTQPEPIALYKAGTFLSEVKHFDRSQHVLFACPSHPTSAWSSKDPYSSSVFPQSDETTDCTVTRRCHVPLNDYILTHDYKPTRSS